MRLRFFYVEDLGYLLSLLLFPIWSNLCSTINEREIMEYKLGTMKKLFFILIAMFVISIHSVSAKKGAASPLKYEITCAGSGQQGFYIVKVSTLIEKKKDINMDILKKCAVHGVIFKGFSGEQGCTAQRAMVKPTVEAQHADFFNAFFVSDYLTYASVVGGTLQTAKAGKSYEISAVIQVSKEQLRKTLEDAGIIRKLGF